MADASKLLDTVIKAPLWFFFAATLFTGAPMLNIPNLVDVGVTSDMRVAGVPLALFTLASISLFVSSAVARSLAVIRGAALAIMELFSWTWRLRDLSPEARAILAVLENDGRHDFYYDPQSVALSSLRDSAIVNAQKVAPTGRDWGLYSLRNAYRLVCSRRPGVMRRALRSEAGQMEDARALMSVARTFAERRV